MSTEPAAAGATAPRHGPLFWAAALGVWTLLGVLTVGQYALGVQSLGAGVARPALGARLLDWMLGAAYLPVLFALVDRRPVGRGRWAPALALHLAAATAFVVVKAIAMMPLDRWIFWPMVPTLPQRGAKALGEVVILALAVGLAHAVALARRLGERERQTLQLETRLAEARLDTLRSQLNPHFLFNTLNALSVLMHRDVAKADAMLTRLAELLRATLKRPTGHEIPLREELDLLDRYLDIMQLRYGPRLLLTREVPADLEGALVPTFLLQPLVENALEHGVARRTGPARVTLAAERVLETGRLRLTVTDDGPGIEPAAARRGAARAGDEGIGLSNTQRRLEELYGPNQRLALEQVPGVGTRAIVELPLREIPAGASPRRRISWVGRSA